MSGWLATVSLAMLSSPSLAAPPLEQATETAIRGALEAPSILNAFDFTGRPQFDVSRDGKWVVYAMERAEIASNTIRVSLWIAHVGSREPPRELLEVRRASTTLAVNPTFSPDASQIAITGYGTRGALAIVDVNRRSIRELPVDFSKLDASINPAMWMDVQWSPVRDELAVALREQRLPPPQGPVSVSVDWDGELRGDQHSRIAIVDATSGTALAVTPADMAVEGFGQALDWSPRGDAFAFSARAASLLPAEGDNSDIYIFDRTRNTTRRIVERPGRDGSPRWSPDGRFVAFITAGEKQTWRMPARLALFEVSSGNIRALMTADDPWFSPYAPSWSGDDVMFVGMKSMGCALFAVSSTGSPRSRQLTPDDLSCHGTAVSRRDGKVYVVRESVASRGDLIVSSPRRWQPSSLSSLPNDPVLAATRLSVVAWPSADQKFSIHGVLIEPTAPHAGRRPLLVVLTGGPSMVTPSVYNPNGIHQIGPALLRGYAVLIPNTRGRGGYGLEFAQAITREKSLFEAPFSDVMSGVDHVVNALGIADPGRLMLAGFSYGGGLSYFTAGHTDRFRAIMANEGAADLIARAALVAGNPRAMDHMRSIFGVADTFDPADRDVLAAQSPLANVSKVRTPLLIECGADSLAGSECLKFFRGVKQTGTPTELVVYPRTGHVLAEPSLRNDSAHKQVAWLDRWDE
ncbi:prolyl oligopeptidase family serine peptidase [Peristeroidobacter soli]|uniref:prolyl oligopeptidase family serine peptidase n=1 Tax=Peristeroidobacter soli TaxID=2497877 RepID=UPI0015890F60|nr:prolyl oligopeptidase family serine peptidase [Peristeroidobacter soli]